MDKIDRPDLDTLNSLSTLADNWETWGQEYKLYLDSDKREGIGWSWRQYIYTDLRKELSDLTYEHCSFCDGYPFDMSKETIEHYKPKNDFPLLAYKWNNLFYCCDTCQKEANKLPFENTIKPDHNDYNFDKIFYVDLGDFKIKVLETLEDADHSLFLKAEAFLIRYGINIPSRITRRRNNYRDLKNYFKSEYGATDARIRNDFPFRYLYDELIRLS